MSRELDVNVIRALWPEQRIEERDGAWLQLDPEGQVIEHMKWPGRYWPLEVPHWAELIEDAWLVVERMREIGWDVRIEHEAGVLQGWVEFVNWEHIRDNNYPLQAQESAATIPEAICRAALKALESSQEVASGTESPEVVS